MKHMKFNQVISELCTDIKNKNKSPDDVVFFNTNNEDVFKSRNLNPSHNIHDTSFDVDEFANYIIELHINNPSEYSCSFCPEYKAHIINLRNVVDLADKKEKLNRLSQSDPVCPLLYDSDVVKKIVGKIDSTHKKCTVCLDDKNLMSHILVESVPNGDEFYKLSDSNKCTVKKILEKK